MSTEPIVNRECSCGRVIALYFEDGEPVSWHVTPPLRELFTLSADEEIALERLARLRYEQMDDFERAQHSARVEERREEVADAVEAEDARDRLMFSPVVLCECGRRYRATDSEPWIRPVEAAGE